VFTTLATQWDSVGTQQQEDQPHGLKIIRRPRASMLVCKTWQLVLDGAILFPLVKCFVFPVLRLAGASSASLFLRRLPRLAVLQGCLTERVVQEVWMCISSRSRCRSGLVISLIRCGTVPCMSRSWKRHGDDLIMSVTYQIRGSKFGKRWMQPGTLLSDPLVRTQSHLIHVTAGVVAALEL